jgi:hypothetical protein
MVGARKKITDLGLDFLDRRRFDIARFGVGVALECDEATPVIIWDEDPTDLDYSVCVCARVYADAHTCLRECSLVCV